LIGESNDVRDLNVFPTVANLLRVRDFNVIVVGREIDEYLEKVPTYAAVRAHNGSGVELSWIVDQHW
jgi:hypothetical protein